MGESSLYNIHSMKSARLILTAAICIVTVATSTCKVREISRAPTDWLVRRLGSEPDTLNPLTSTDAYSSEILDNIYETLVRRNPDTLKLEPWLAESWDISPDGMVITFHMRKGVRFTDGHPATAEDVVYAYRKIMDPGVNAPHLRNYYKDIEKVEATDKYTIRFTYKEPYFRAVEICGYTPCIPKHLFEKSEDFNTSELGRKPVGTGPYEFREWVTGQKIILVRNENYWGERPQIKTVAYKFIHQDSTALIELKKRHIDYMGLTPLQWAKQTGGERFEAEFSKEKYYQPNYNYIGWNMRKPPFDDKRVRRAMTMLVARRTILDTVMFGLGKIVTGPAYINSPYYDHSIEPWPYDPAGAKKLLEEAGWKDHDGDGVRDKNGEPFKFEFLISSGSTFSSQLATIIKEELDKIGVLMEVRRLEWATFLKLIDERNFDAVTLGWALSVETDPYQLWHSSQSERGSNFVGFKNERADRIIVMNRRTLDRDKRIGLMKEFHRILHEEQPYTFLFCRPSLVAVHKRFENVVVHKLGLRPREWRINAEWKED